MAAVANPADRDSDRGRDWLFGYGSLAALPSHLPSRERHPDGFVADLRGCARVWGVAMDNSRDLPGYKFYEDARGARPEVFVAFLDVARGSPSDLVNGVCRPVGAAELAELDARERNYERVDVSDRVDAGGERVWAYIGSVEGRERLRHGTARGSAVISADYLALVRDGFRRLGEREWRAARASLEPGALPVRDLRRIDLPPAPKG